MTIPDFPHGTSIVASCRLRLRKGNSPSFETYLRALLHGCDGKTSHVNSYEQNIGPPNRRLTNVKVYQ